MLHLLSLNHGSVAMLDRIASDDDVLLQGSLVWTARLGHSENQFLLALQAKRCQIYVLIDWLSAFGISESELLADVHAISYHDFVELTVKNPVIHTWC